VSEVFGKYEVVEKLATGGMAEILLARSNSIGGMERHCVIKRILPSYSQDLQFVSMFIDEARITIGLDHQNIVRLFDFGQHEGTYFMAMEYVDGTDLAALLRSLFLRGHAVPPHLAAYIAHELLRGLTHAHDKKDHRGNPLAVVHRDVSPQNVLISRGGEVKLTDFGIAAARNKLTLTTPGTVLGKSAYMSPEQALGETVDGRTDLWAAGVILHEMLTGSRLFAAETPVATISRVVKAEVEPPSSKREELPAVLDEIVLRALARNPDERWASASEMADALAGAVDSLGGSMSADALAAYLVSIEWADDTASLRPSLHHTRELDISPDATTAIAQGDPEVLALLEQLHIEPDLWTLVRVGERCADLGANRRALAAFRCAAAVFAYRGLLVQAICAYDGARQLLTPPEVFEDLVALGDIDPGKRNELIEAISRFEADEYWQLLKALDPGDLGSLIDTAPVARPATPLFGYLAPREFAQLVESVKVRRVLVGETIITEGDPGDALFAIGNGRVVVHCAAGKRDEELELVAEVGEPTYVESNTPAITLPYALKDRVYLSALAEGDFFGEFSFLTERPRSASVEAITDVLLLEIDHDAVKRIGELEPGFEQPLLEFYKERVVELMMAKSPVFSLLSPDDRRELLAGALVTEAPDQSLVIEEGAASDSLFFIKRGEVEIYRRDEDGTPIFINKLGQGQFFGEISALRGTPRTLNVRAMGNCELFRIDRADLAAVLNREPRLRRIFEQTIASRTAETDERVREYQRILYST
jgi:serine/threonine protein kinase/CRP-like cAMP-binding protein